MHICYEQQGKKQNGVIGYWDIQVYDSLPERVGYSTDNV